MALPGETGHVNKNCPDCPSGVLRAQVLHSMAGWYIGTKCDYSECENSWASYSRESGYYPTGEAADRALEEGNFGR
jgi:hypothetical protein